MAQPPNTFNDATVLRTALYGLLANDAALFAQIAEASVLAGEWLEGSWTPSYVDASRFTVPADQTALYLPGRAVRLHQAGGYARAFVLAASFDPASGLTTVGLAQPILEASLDQVGLGILSPGGAAPQDLASQEWVQGLLDGQPRRVTSWDYQQADANQPEDASLGASQSILLAHGARRRVMLQERVMQPGLGLRLVLVLAMSTTAAANLSLNWAYRVVGPGQGLGLAVDFWQAGKVYAAGAQVIGLTPEGWRAFSAAGGTSGATEPTWPSAGNVADNGWNWAAGEVVFKNLALSLPVTAQAAQGFWVDDPALQIPAAELTSAEQMLVGFLWVPAASPHPGGLHLLDAWLRPVEV